MDIDFKETLEQALALFKALLSGEEVSKNKNKELYDQYIYHTDVEEVLQFMMDKLDLGLYRYNEKLYLCPSVENNIFGYTNEELKRKIPRIIRNDELYLCYFIIMTVITMYYKESAMDTPIAYIKFGDLVEAVTGKFESMITIQDIEKISEEKAFNFAEIAKVWQRLPDAREDFVTGGKNDKISFIRNVCNFLRDEKLVIIDEDRNVLFPTDRFKAIIYNYFEDRENKNDIFQFVYQLGGEQNASY